MRDFGPRPHIGPRREHEPFGRVFVDGYAAAPLTSAVGAEKGRGETRERQRRRQRGEEEDCAKMAEEGSAEPAVKGEHDVAIVLSYMDDEHEKAAIEVRPTFRPSVRALEPGRRRAARSSTSRRRRRRSTPRVRLSSRAKIVSLRVSCAPL